MNWDTSETILQYVGAGVTGYYQLKGFSLTSTEYLAAEFNNTAWYDFGWYTYISATSDSSGTTTPAYYVTQYANSSSASSSNPSNTSGNCGLTLNVYWLMENIFSKFVQTGSGSISEPYTAPCIRIPLCADYWLNGSASQTTINSTTLSPYYWQGQCNVSFTGPQYQAAILELIYYCYNTWDTNNPNIPITFILDLHWNYASPSPLTSGSYSVTPNTQNPPSSGTNPTISYFSNTSSEQIPLCGVCTSDGLNLVDNTLDFWESVSSLISSNPCVYTYSNSPGTLFTKSSTTTEMPQTLLNNIFFEAYNEPFTDYVTTSTNSTTTYADEYSLYINGGTGVYNGDTYSFTGMLAIYETIRNNCQNIVIFGGSDSYSFMNFNTTLAGNLQWNSDNTIANTYNCFTKLQDAIIAEGLTFNAMINFHPYAGLYSGGLKHPGQYDPSYYGDSTTSNTTSYVPIPGFGQIVAALQNPALTEFYMSCPIICTEYGQYDLPFSTYSTNSQGNTAGNYQYPSSYLAPNSQSLYTYLGSASYSQPFYNGNYVSATGTSQALPAIIGYVTDFNYYNISYCAWAIRPNSGGSGQITNTNTYSAQSWLITNTNQYYYSWTNNANAWAGFQPDAASGCWCAPNTTNGTAAGAADSPDAPASVGDVNDNYQLMLIGEANGQDISTTTINFGCQGADFQYIFDNFY